MTTVVLLAINAKYIHSSLSVWVLSAGIKSNAKSNHNVQIVEATIHQDNSEIVGKVAGHNPDVVGISMYIWNAKKLPEIIMLLRQRLPKAKIILGGPEASYNADYWLAHGADHVLHGEGEYTLPALLDEVYCPLPRKGMPPAGDGGCLYSECGTAPPCLPIDPYTDEYLKTLGGRLAYIETSRGCPFTCAFCLSAGTNVRFFPMDIVKKQLYKLSQSGAHTIKLVDRTFNCNAERAYEIFMYIIEMDTDCCFHFEVAADLFDGRTLELLSSARPGRIQLEAGLQSFFMPALKAASRQTDPQKAEKNIRSLLEKGNIHIHVDLIAGLPYETLVDFIIGFGRAFALRAHTLQLGFLKLLHGSSLRKQADELGIKYSKEPPYEIQSSPWLAPEDIQALKQAENALQHTWNKQRFISTLEYALSATGENAFSFFHGLGGAAPNHGADLADYAKQIYDFIVDLQGIDKTELKDHMTYDWLGMVKGKNMPDFMRNPDIRRNLVTNAAKRVLKHDIRRDESAILLSGKGIYVDSENRDPVTGLYKVWEHS